MPETRKILLIENQRFQFDAIIQFLKPYTVFPEEAFFINFIDNVRVWVNPQYNEEYREKGLTFVKKYITKNQIELIIMDYTLGGACNCKTGIDLAEELNKDKRAENCFPILFLSKLELNEKERLIKYENYLSKFPENRFTKWVHKGYFGDEILNKNYFEKIVLPEIRTLLGKSCLEQLNEILVSKQPSLADPDRNLPGSKDLMLNHKIGELLNIIHTLSHEECIKLKKQITETSDNDLETVVNKILERK